eukprot:816720-Alexandrium_andersonii.AAC.1
MQRGALEFMNEGAGRYPPRTLILWRSEAASALPSSLAPEWTAAAVGDHPELSPGTRSALTVLSVTPGQSWIDCS